MEMAALIISRIFPLKKQPPACGMTIFLNINTYHEPVFLFEPVFYFEGYWTHV